MSRESQMLAEIFGVDGIVVVAVLAVLLFGGAAIPKLARNLGSAKNQFENGLAEGKKASAIDPTEVAPVSAHVPASVSAE
jgi:Sec-independent protein translocase protein TatA